MSVDALPDSRLKDTAKVKWARVCALALVMLLCRGASAQLPTGTPIFPVNAKWVTDHGGQVYNVMAYGAVCSPGTDNSIVLNSLFSGVGSGAHIYFPACAAGYGTANPLVLPVAASGIILEGPQAPYINGVGTSELASIVVTPGLTSPIDMLQVSAAGAEIHNLQFNGSNEPIVTPPPSSGNEPCVGNGIVLDNAARGIVQANNISNFPCSGILLDDGVLTTGGNNNALQISDNVISTNGRFGIEQHTQNSNENAINILRNDIEGNAVDGLALNGGMIDVKGGLYSNNHGVGIRVSYGSSSPANTTLTGPLTGNSSAAQTLTPASMTGIYQYALLTLDQGLSDQEIIIVKCLGPCAFWQPSHAYSAGNQFIDQANHIQQVTTAGTSGSSPPAVNDSGGTVADGSAVETDEGLATTFQAYVFKNHSPSSITLKGWTQSASSTTVHVEDVQDLEGDDAGNVVFLDCLSHDYANIVAPTTYTAGCNTWGTFQGELYLPEGPYGFEWGVFAKPGFWSKVFLEPGTGNTPSKATQLILSSNTYPQLGFNIQTGGGNNQAPGQFMVNGVIVGQTYLYCAYGTSAACPSGQFAATQGSISTNYILAGQSGEHYYTFGAVVDVTAAGSGCTGSTTLVLNLVYYDPNASGYTTYSFSSVTLASGNGTAGTSFSYSYDFLQASLKVVEVSTTLTPDTSCTTKPYYQLTPRLAQNW